MAQRAAEGDANFISERVIGAAIEVHRFLGPGLLESVYEECLAHEFKLRELRYRRQAGIGSKYKGVELGLAFRVDFEVENSVLVELKAVEAFQEVHTAQLLTYLRLTNRHLGLLINFNVPALWRGVKRVANNL